MTQIIDDLPYTRVETSHKVIAKHYAKLLSKSMLYHNKDTMPWRSAQGMLGEVVLAQMLGCLDTWRRHKDLTSTLESSWDDGFDMSLNDKHIDCKVIAFRSAVAIDRLMMFRGEHKGADVYVQMLINESELRREKEFDSIDWIDKVWCAGFIEADAFERQNGKLCFPINSLKSIKTLR